MNIEPITEPTTAPCPKGCGNETRTYSVAGRICREVCDECRNAGTREEEKAREAARLASAAQRFAATLARFPAYDPKRTDWKRVSPGLSDAAGKWMQREDQARGLWLCGPTRLGKTRILFGLMARLAALGKMAGYGNHQQICDWIAAAAMRDASAMRNLDQLRRADVLLIDDLGKGRPTEAATGGLYGLLEWFTSRDKPVVVTSQAAGGWMVTRFGEDGGEAIVGRLSTFCELVEAGLAK